MKTRVGFVTNSSSSSFIVGFKNKPSDPREMQEILFGDQAAIEYNGIEYDTYEMAYRIFQEIRHTVSPRDAEDCLDDDNWYCPDREKWKKIGDADMIFCYFYFNDHDEKYGGALEHGGIFNRLPHLIESRH